MHEIGKNSLWTETGPLRARRRGKLALIAELVRLIEQAAEINRNVYTEWTRISRIEQHPTNMGFLALFP